MSQASEEEYGVKAVSELMQAELTACQLYLKHQRKGKALKQMHP